MTVGDSDLADVQLVVAKQSVVRGRVLVDNSASPPKASTLAAEVVHQYDLAEQYFRAASALDDGDEAKQEEAAAAYRKALEHDPYLVAALINLANIHYSRDELVEAQALYERAIGLESDFFEAHFNLGNIYHDLGRFTEAQACYTEALPYWGRTLAGDLFYSATLFGLYALLSRRLSHQQATA